MCVDSAVEHRGRALGHVTAKTTLGRRDLFRSDGGARRRQHPQTAYLLVGPGMETVAKTGWFRLNLWLHRWSSLIATPFFLILCITGTVLIFHEEIDRALGYVPGAGTKRMSAFRTL